MGQNALLLILVLFSMLPGLGCHSPYYRDQGAAWGGLAGAGIGAAIGEANDEPLAGAVIGSVLGAVTGGAAGQALDDVAQANAYAIPRNSAATIADVVAMTKAGLGEDLIVSQIQSQGMSIPISTTDLIALKQQGVSDRVLQALQQPVAVGTIFEPICGPGPPPPVVVPPSFVVPRRRHYPPFPPTHYPGVVRPPPRVGWGVSVGF